MTNLRKMLLLGTALIGASFAYSQEAQAVLVRPGEPERRRLCHHGKWLHR